MRTNDRANNMTRTKSDLCGRQMWMNRLSSLSHTHICSLLWSWFFFHSLMMTPFLDLLNGWVLLSLIICFLLLINACVAWVWASLLMLYLGGDFSRVDCLLSLAQASQRTHSLSPLVHLFQLSFCNSSSNITSWHFSLKISFPVCLSHLALCCVSLLMHGC